VAVERGLSRPTRPGPIDLLPAELDLTENEIAVMDGISVIESEVDLSDEILVLADDIEDRT
jgi:hypothetical protein